MKRNMIISVLLAILLLLSAVPCYAAEAAVISGQCTDAVPGAEVVFSVSIRDNPGIAAFRILLTYDTDVLTPTYTEDEESGEQMLCCTQGDFASGGSLYTEEKGTSLRFFWYDTKNAVRDGTLFSVHFRVNDDAELGDAALGVFCVQADTVDADGKPVAFRCEDGKITVREFCPTLRLAETDAKQGEVFDYPVYIDDNPGLAAVKLALSFDAASLEVMTDPDGNVLCSAPVGSVSCNLQKSGGTYYLTAIWWHTADVSSSGPLFTIRMRAKEDAALQKTPIDLIESFTEVKNSEEEDVPLAQLSGAVNVCDSSEILVQVTTHRAEVTVENCAAIQVIAAFYDADGRMVNLRVFTPKNRHGIIVLTDASLDFSELTWRVFLLDSNCRAICPAYDHNT